MLAVWGVLVIGSIDNFLSPRLVGRRARLHELLIFFSVLGGLQVFGVLGLVLGPVLAAITLALIEVVRQANRPPSETRQETTVIEAQAEVREYGDEHRGRAGSHLVGARSRTTAARLAAALNRRNSAPVGWWPWLKTACRPCLGVRRRSEC